MSDADHDHNVAQAQYEARRDYANRVGRVVRSDADELPPLAMNRDRLRDKVEVFAGSKEKTIGIKTPAPAETEPLPPTFAAAEKPATVPAPAPVATGARLDSAPQAYRIDPPIHFKVPR